ncbi:MAG: hypothetical protein NVSMB23_04640 [Myxococcales bacterium]
MVLAAWSAVGCAAPRTAGGPLPGVDEPARGASSAEEAYVRALRAEHRALERERALLSWVESTTGAPASGSPSDLRPLFGRAASEALRRAQENPATAPQDALALRFLRRALAAEKVEDATAPFDDALSRAEVGLSVPSIAGPVALRDAPLLLAHAPDPAARRRLYAAVSRATSDRLDPLRAQREAAAQGAARAAGYADYVALSEDLRDADLHALLAEGAAYVRATESIFTATLDRVAREELGLARDELRGADLARLWKTPSLARHFAEDLEVPALSWFLSGIGLDLRTARGTAVRIDAGAASVKRPRAFVDPVDAPGDVRLSIKPSGGLDDYWTLFHEAGHAVHFAAATVAQPELVTLGAMAPAEAFGELFRQAFSDRRFLIGYRDFLVARGRPAPTDAELGAVLRRTALVEMACLRRYAFAKIAYELRLHGRPLSDLGPALALLPRPERLAGDGEEPLRELYRQLFSVASGVALGEDESARFRADVDDTFRSADYARAFALAGTIGEALRARFGAGWTADLRAGPFLRAALFSQGTSLSAEQVAERLGFPPRVDFAGAAVRAGQLLREADLLAAGTFAAGAFAAGSAAAGPVAAAQKSAGNAASGTLPP